MPQFLRFGRRGYHVVEMWTDGPHVNTKEFSWYHAYRFYRAKPTQEEAEHDLRNFIKEIKEYEHRVD